MPSHVNSERRWLAVLQFKSIGVKALLKALISHSMFIFGLNWLFFVSKCLCPKGNITFLTTIYMLELEVVEIYFNRNERY